MDMIYRPYLSPPISVYVYTPLYACLINEFHGDADGL